MYAKYGAHLANSQSILNIKHHVGIYTCLSFFFHQITCFLLSIRWSKSERWGLQLRIAGTLGAPSTDLWAIRNLAKPPCKANLLGLASSLVTDTSGISPILGSFIYHHVQLLDSLEAYSIVTEYPAPELDFMAHFHKIIKIKLTRENALVTVAFSLANHNGEP